MNLGKMPVLVCVFPFASPAVGKLTRSLVDLIALTGADVETVCQVYDSEPQAHRVHPLRVKVGRVGPKSGRIWRAFRWCSAYIGTQIEMTWRVLRCSRSGGIVVFFLGPHYSLPAAAARLTGRRVLYIPGGLASDAAKHEYGAVTTTIVRVLENLTALSSHAVAMESNIECVGRRHKWRALAARCVPIPPDAPPAIADRPPVVGFLGRLEVRKGIRTYLQMAPLLPKNMTVKVAGGGSLVEEVRSAAVSQPNIEYCGWISEKELPHFFRKTRYLVIPSSSEGLPTVALEAMAQGVILVATPVGGLPDLIEDGVTGFLAKSSSLEHVTEATLRALSAPNSEEISVNAREHVQRYYSEAAATARYQELLSIVGGI